MLQIALNNNWICKHADVKTAFLYGVLTEDIYLRAPLGYSSPTFTGFWKLNKTIYGLKQSNHIWGELFKSFVLSTGLSQSSHDPCLFYLVVKGKLTALICIYVDDALIAGDSSFLASFEQQLRSTFDINHLDPVKLFVGIKISRTDNSITLSQTAAIHDLIQKHQLSYCKDIWTPAEVGSYTPTDDITPCTHPYRSLVGSLLYIAIHTRPDILFAVTQAGRFSQAPTNNHWTLLTRILRFLKTTPHLGIALYKGASTLTCYSDSDWASEITRRRSTGGHLIFFGTSLIAYRCKTQKLICLSTTEAEYVALSNLNRDLTSLRLLLAELMVNLPTITIYEDNQACISYSRNPAKSTHSKHIDVRFHHVKDSLDANLIALKYVATSDNLADILTKGLPKPQHSRISQKLLASC